MIDYIESSSFPPFVQICEANVDFHLLSKFHGCYFDPNDVPSTIDRWKTLQGKFLLKVNDEVGFVLKDYPKRKKIPWVEHWHTIVANVMLMLMAIICHKNTHDVIKELGAKIHRLVECHHHSL